MLSMEDAHANGLVSRTRRITSSRSRTIEMFYEGEDKRCIVGDPRMTNQSMIFFQGQPLQIVFLGKQSRLALHLGLGVDEGSFRGDRTRSEFGLFPSPLDIQESFLFRNITCGGQVVDFNQIGSSGAMTSLALVFIMRHHASLMRTGRVSTVIAS